MPVRGLGVQPTLLIGSPVPVRQSNNPATAPMAIRPIWAAGTAMMSISAADTIALAILGTSGVSVRAMPINARATLATAADFRPWVEWMTTRQAERWREGRKRT